MKKLLLVFFLLLPLFSFVYAGSDEYLTRAEAVKMIMDDVKQHVDCGLEALYFPYEYSPPKSHPFFPELKRAYCMFILNGSDDGWRPDDLLNYAELSALIVRTYFYNNELNAPGKVWYQNYIDLLKIEELEPRNDFFPENNITKKELQKMIEVLDYRPHLILDLSTLEEGDEIESLFVIQKNTKEDKIIETNIILKLAPFLKIKGRFANFGLSLIEGRLVSGVLTGLFVGAEAPIFPFWLKVDDGKIVSGRGIKIHKFFEDPDLSMSSYGTVSLNALEIKIKSKKAQRSQRIEIEILKGEKAFFENKNPY